MIEFVEDLVSSVLKVVNDEELSKRIVRQLTKDFGGEQVYIPMERSAFKEDIEEQVYQDFLHYNGSIKVIAQKNGIPSRAVYKIVNKKRKERRKNLALSQPSLFD